MHNIKNIVFDLGGVLIDLDPARTFKAFEELIVESRESRVESKESKVEKKPTSNSVYGRNVAPTRQAGDRLPSQSTLHDVPSSLPFREGSGLGFSPSTTTPSGVGLSFVDLMGGGESTLMQQYQVGAISTDDFFAHIASGCRPDVTREQLEQAWCAMLLSLPSHRLAMLRRLREAGYRVFILSNTNEAHTAWVYRHFEEIGLRVGTHIDHAYYSNEIGFAKPYQECFVYIIRNANLIPAETLYFDDLAKNIEAGKKAGFHSVQVLGDEWLPIAEKLIRKH